MPQHDYDVANQAGAGFRADINSALAAVVSNNSGATEPATMFAFQLWADTTSGLLKQRNAANTAWVTVGTLGSANLGLIPASIIDAAGDLIVGTAADTAVRLAKGMALQVLRVNAGATALEWAESRILQVVHYDTGAMATGTTVIPFDDTIPQITEGDQYMSLAITPLKSDSTLVVDVVAHVSCSIIAQVIAALFRDATASAIGVMNMTAVAATAPINIMFSVKAAAVSTSATTFKVRIGPSAAGTITFNGNNGARVFGGALSSSIRITEIAA